MPYDSLISTRPQPGGNLGGLVLAGRRLGSHGVRSETTVRFPSFGLTYVTSGQGHYRDERLTASLGPGSLVFVFPGHPHWYGPAPRTTWDEVFLVFEGPLFQLALERGLHSPKSPLHRLTPTKPWLQRIERFRTRQPPLTPSARDAEACDVLKLIIDIRANNAAAALSSRSGTDWYSVSLSLLDSDLDGALALQDVAANVGIPYETWRRYFRRRSGYSPANYRLIRRIEAAAIMLDETPLSTREIAATLGFSDEHHLIRHFRSSFDLTPRQYRNRNSRAASDQRAVGDPEGRNY